MSRVGSQNAVPPRVARPGGALVADPATILARGTGQACADVGLPRQIVEGPGRAGPLRRCRRARGTEVSGGADERREVGRVAVAIEPGGTADADGLRLPVLVGAGDAPDGTGASLRTPMTHRTPVTDDRVDGAGRTLARIEHQRIRTIRARRAVVSGRAATRGLRQIRPCREPNQMEF